MANFNLNKVMLGGRLTAKPELKQTPNGVSCLRFTIAVSRHYVKDEEAQRADFISCVAWRKTAEFIAQYFDKGSSIYLDGELQVRDYTDKEGNKRYVSEVIVSAVQFVDSKAEVDAARGLTNSIPEQMPSSYAPAAPTAPTAPQFETILDDDKLPF